MHNSKVFVVKLHNIEVGNDFFTEIPRAQATKEK
jgi:hypothetical protein